MTTFLPFTASAASAPAPWYKDLDGTLRLLQDPAFAIPFALDHVPDAGLCRIFLEEWQDDHAEGTTHRVRYLLEGMKEALSYGQPEAAE